MNRYIEEIRKILPDPGKCQEKIKLSGKNAQGEGVRKAVGS